MMLEHLGHPAAAQEVLAVIQDVLAQTPVRTPDPSGAATTEQVTAAVVDAVQAGRARKE